MASYPVIEQKSLPTAPRGGPWGLGFRARQLSALPLPNAHEAVVYKSGNRYVIDDGRSRPTDAHVANATNISVVDMRENAPVTAQVSIPSAGADVFAVQVTFLCTVRKPEDVVDSGLTDMAEPLTQYLARHQPLFHVGEDHEFDDIAVVRRNVTAEVKAYVSVRPPRFRGMEVTLGNVQVLTPADLAEFERARRERRREGLLTSEGQRQDHFLAREREEHQQVMDVLKQRYQHDLDAQAERNREELAEMKRRLDEDRELQQRRHEQLVAEMRQIHYQEQEQRQFVHDQEQRSKRFDQAIVEASKLAQAIGADRTEVPSLIAAGAGERTIAETADLLGQDRRADHDAQASDSLRRETWGREDDRARWQARREDERVRWQAEREDARLRYQLKVDQLGAELAVYSEAIKRGLADTRTIDQIAAVISGAVQQLESASAKVGAPSSATADQVKDAEPVYDAEVVDEPAAEPGPPTSEPEPRAKPEAQADDHNTEQTNSEVREEDLG